MSNKHETYLELVKGLEQSLEETKTRLSELVQDEIKRIGRLPNGGVTVDEYGFYQQYKGRY
jgi:hypothetical protein